MFKLLGFSLLVDALMVLLQGFVLSVLWGWFVVPTFGLPSLSVPMAIGICLIVGMLTSNRSSTDEELDEALIASAAHNAVIPLFSLFAGWFVHSLM